jgi:hypothetical protein
MLTIEGGGYRNCDGVSRRSFLQVGALCAGGLTLAGALRQEASAQLGGANRRKAVIQIWLAGGPSHIDMYDLKPDAPAEFRGEFRPIATNVPGIDISEHLPLQAKQMDKPAILSWKNRSFLATGSA